MTQTGSNYFRFVGVSFSQALSHMTRGKQPLVLTIVSIVPALLPLGAYFLWNYKPDEADNSLFSQVANGVYLQTLAPLIALFFGCSLVSEDVESQTIIHILTRPVPRSAWVLGKYLAFNLAALVSLGLGLAVFYAANVLVGRVEIDSTSLGLLLRFLGIIALALLAYSALCAYFGSSQKRPIVLSLVVIYGWQRIAMLMPGLVDFLTIDKYVRLLLPKETGRASSDSMAMMLLEAQKKEWVVGSIESILALCFISFLFLTLTVCVVRWREYTSARILQD